MIKPLILYNNILETSTVTQTSQDAEYPATNLTTRLPYEWWSPSGTGTHSVDFTFGSAVPANTFAFFSHNSYEKSTQISLKYWDGASFQTVLSNMSASDSQVVFRTFTEVASTVWRIECSVTDADFKLGIAMLGVSMEVPLGFQSGFTPPSMVNNDKMLNGISETGLLMGRTILARKAKTTFNFDNMTAQWVRDTYQPFISDAVNNPFFLSWNNTDYPNEAVFCVLDKINPPSYGEYLMNVSLSCEVWHKLRV